MRVPEISMRDAVSKADQLLRQRRAKDAISLSARLIASDPKLIPARLIKARGHQQLHEHEQMLDECRLALQASPGDPDAVLLHIEALICSGDIRTARQQIQDRTEHWQREPILLARLAEALTQLGDHQDAADVLRDAHTQKPTDPTLLYNLASAEIALGDFQQAEQHLNELIAQAPQDYDSYYNRSTLRKQTASDNHIDELKSVLGSNPPEAGRVQVLYALAKELEDLGKPEEAFAYLKQGADLRRRLMSYKVEGDIETMELIAQTLDQQSLSRMRPSASDFAPIFVMGLPRTGTTLIDRVVSSHPKVTSIGEVNDLPMAITQLCGAVQSKAELIMQTAELNIGSLAAAIKAYMTLRAPDADIVLEKTPLNYLYLGLLAKALPSAKFIHLVRDPMDAGYAIYKTLFRMGYPFSYDLSDLGRYINAKTDLMAHWEREFPERIITVQYEEFVSDPEHQTRELIEGLRLSWDDRCLNFHQNTSASATASAAQVRQPVYTSSVGKWQRVAAELKPLSDIIHQKRGVPDA